MKHLNIDFLPDNLEIAHMGDVHGFVKGFPFKKVKNEIEKIKKKKHCYVTLGGDMIDSMLPQDKRYVFGQSEGNFERAGEQRDGIIELLEPIADRILWGIQGNHEFRIMNVMDVTKEILQGLGCDIYGKNEDSAYLMIAQVGDVKILDWHGFPTVNSQAGTTRQRRVNNGERVKRVLSKVGGVDDCEVAVMHHIHKMFVVPPTSMETMRTVNVNGKLKAIYPGTPVRKYINKKHYYYDDDDRWYASSGAFMPSYVEGFSSYAERRGYRPSDMGYVKTIIEKGKVKEVVEVKV